MRLSYLTSDEVHFDWLSRLAERFGIALESVDNLKVSTDPVPDAVLYDWDYLPAEQRESLCAELCEQPVSGVVAVHGYNLSDSETQALQRNGVLVFPRLIPHVIRFLRRLVNRNRAARGSSLSVIGNLPRGVRPAGGQKESGREFT
jgi:hypothetical protein